MGLFQAAIRVTRTFGSGAVDKSARASVSVRLVLRWPIKSLEKPAADGLQTGDEEKRRILAVFPIERALFS